LRLPRGCRAMIDLVIMVLLSRVPSLPLRRLKEHVKFIPSGVGPVPYDGRAAN